MYGGDNTKQAEMCYFHCGPSRQENVSLDQNVRLDQNEEKKMKKKFKNSQQCY